MVWGSGAASVLVGVLGGVVLVCAVLFGARFGGRRTVGAAGLGLLLLGLSLSGLVDVVASALRLFSFNPLRWAGLAAGGVGLVMLAAAGFLPGRRRRAARADRAAAKPKDEVGRRDGAQGEPSASVDDDLADIEEILRRRGIE